MVQEQLGRGLVRHELSPVQAATQNTCMRLVSRASRGQHCCELTHLLVGSHRGGGHRLCPLVELGGGGHQEGAVGRHVIEKEERQGQASPGVCAANSVHVKGQRSVGSLQHTACCGGGIELAANHGLRGLDGVGQVGESEGWKQEGEHEELEGGGMRAACIPTCSLEDLRAPCWDAQLLNLIIKQLTRMCAGPSGASYEEFATPRSHPNSRSRREATFQAPLRPAMNYYVYAYAVSCAHPAACGQGPNEAKVASDTAIASCLGRPVGPCCASIPRATVSRDTAIDARAICSRLHVLQSLEVARQSSCRKVVQGA